MSRYTKEDIFRIVDEEDVAFIRLQFCDIFGIPKNIAIAASQLESALNNECMFDGISIEGFVRGEDSEMYLYPDLDSFEIYPWRPQSGKVARMFCNVYTADKEPFMADPRNILENVIKKAKENGVNLVLGSDCIAADKFANDANTQVCPANAIPEGWEGLDAGPETRKAFAAAIENAKTILWNGPAGVFEFDNFIGGSKAIADAIAKATANGAFSLIGGGDSVACINKFGMADQVSYISTGGGALLEAIEGKVLPGVAAIKGE